LYSPRLRHTHAAVQFKQVSIDPDAGKVAPSHGFRLAVRSRYGDGLPNGLPKEASGPCRSPISTSTFWGREGAGLATLARAHPERSLTVLCGHTHSPGVARILPNLVVYTGAAEYGSPMVQRVFEF
jgi:hypothetical protein